MILSYWEKKKWIYLLTLVTVLLEIFFYWKLNVPFVKIPLFLCMWKFFLSYCVLFYQLWVISYRGIGLFLIVERPFQETN